MESVRVILQVDESLLREVIRPLQKERKFSKLIVELLKAYQEDEYVNASATISLESQENTQREELIKNLKGMRENIEALQYLNEETKNLTEEGTEFFTEDLLKTEKEESQTETKMLNSGDYVTREEFNEIIEGQRKILELLKGGSLYEKALGKGGAVEGISVKEEIQLEIEELNNKETINTNEINESEQVSVEEENNVVEDEELEDGSSIAESLLAGMDFQF